jgi:hypothetical protein
LTDTQAPDEPPIQQELDKLAAEIELNKGLRDAQAPGGPRQAEFQQEINELTDQWNALRDAQP